VSSVNTVAVSGRLTRDPELKTFGEDGKVASFGLANDRSIKRDGEWTTVPNFFDISVFGNYAELIDKKARKGDLVTVQGELRYETWENEAGEKRSKVSIIAKTVEGEFSFRKADGSDTPARDTGNGAAGDQGALPVGGTDAADIPF
jgi:single-strand DNA-binding protein